jgi:energy-coupling factor transporter ATP-binding protein EcfA2
MFDEPFQRFNETFQSFYMKALKSNNPQTFRNILTLMIMATGGGKSTLIQYICNLINDDDTRYYMLSGSTNNLSNQIPDSTIYANPDKEKTYDVLSRIWSCQQKMSRYKKFIYNNIRDVILLLDKVDKHSSTMLRKLYIKLKKSSRDEVSRINAISLLSRKIACYNKDKLLAIVKTDQETLLTKFLTHKGYKTVIIIDDLSEVIEDLLKTKKTKGIMTAIVTRGRHFDVTLLMAVHTPTDVTGVMRSNAGAIFWGKKQEMMVSADLKNYNKRVINEHKNTIVRKSKYAKFIYLKSTESIYTFEFNPFRFNRNKKLGCIYFHILSKKYKKGEANDTYDNIKLL